MTRYTPVPTRLNLPATENGVLEDWRRDHTFEKSVARRAGGSLYAFDDGPPFATGLPHYGHILTSYIKDVVPRYFTMRGYHVPRRWGWDCHGLPVEYQVEKELGLSGPQDIAALGLDRFTEECRSLVLRYANEWERIVTRLGRWVDFAHAYKTMDRSYMDSVLWAFHRLHELGLLYEGQKVVPYCCRCQTPLSNFEARLDDAYRARSDESCTVKFRLRDDVGDVVPGLDDHAVDPPSNVALAVNPDLEYVLCLVDGEGCGWPRAPAFAFPQLSEPLQAVKGRELVGLTLPASLPVFRLTSRSVRSPAGRFVSASDGTGIVHLAPAFGEDDEVACRGAGISGPMPVTDDGTFTHEVPEFAGTPVFDASSRIVRRLAERGLVFEQAPHLHDYPHCWRCDQPLMYRRVRSWFVQVTALKDALLAHNRNIHWVPEHIRDGRFGQWLDNARDWAISRNRFWGAPIPVWRCGSCAAHTGHPEREGSGNSCGRRCARPSSTVHRRGDCADAIDVKARCCGCERFWTAGSNPAPCRLRNCTIRMRTSPSLRPPFRRISSSSTSRKRGDGSTPSTSWRLHCSSSRRSNTRCATVFCSGPTAGRCPRGCGTIQIHWMWSLSRVRRPSYRIAVVAGGPRGGYPLSGGGGTRRRPPIHPATLEHVPLFHDLRCH